MGIGNFYPIQHEPDDLFIHSLLNHPIKRIRLLRLPEMAVKNALAQAACNLNVGEVMANGRLELLHFLREVSISRDYHRYGNLGEREGEKRHVFSDEACTNCKGCH